MRIKTLIISFWSQDINYVPVTMIWWTNEMRRSWSDNIWAVGSGSPCSSWRRGGMSWTSHVSARSSREVLWRWGWRRVIIPAVKVRIHRETIRRWDFTGTGCVPVTRETWSVWTARAWGRRMNRAKVSYIWTWVTRCWRCWFCEVALLAQ